MIRKISCFYLVFIGVHLCQNHFLVSNVNQVRFFNDFARTVFVLQTDIFSSDSESNRIVIISIYENSRFNLVYGVTF
jgi:hypothetical protein